MVSETNIANNPGQKEIVAVSDWGKLMKVEHYKSLLWSQKGKTDHLKK